LDLERKVLAAAFKFSFESGDSDGAALAHKGLCAVIQQQLFSGDGSSSGSVIPASVWNSPQASSAESAPAAGSSAMGDEDDETVTLPVYREEDELTVSLAALTEHDALTEAVPAMTADELVAFAADAGMLPEHAAETEAVPAMTAEELASFADTVAAASEIQESGMDNNLQPIEVPSLTAEELAALSQADPTAPLNYLDFGDEGAADESVAQAPPEPTPAEEPPAPLTPSQLIRTQSPYQILGVSQVASYEEIHMRFLRLMRRLLRNRYAMENTITDMREFREILRAVCVAHDILKDPVTRTDYDLRQMGMRHDGTLETPVDVVAPAQRTRLMLGELLECAQILEPAELQIALDMHKAEPGVQFGEFLVSAHFLSQDELDCALLAQRLISMGKITVNQFRTAMYRMRDDGTAFFDTLMLEGWLSPSDIFDESSDLWSTGESAPAPAAPPAVVASHPELEFDFEDSESNEVSPELSDSADDADSEDQDSMGKHDGNGTDDGADDEDHNNGDRERNGETPEPAAVAATQKEFNGDTNWSERDALDVTQSLDISAFRATLKNSVSDDD
jgi:hypothetical protein